MSQITFKWPQVAPSYAPSDFIISSSNEHAATFLDAWPTERGSTALLTGTRASGKTHLMHRWIERTQGKIIPKEQLGQLSSADLWGPHTYAALEDVHAITDETSFFHLLRHTESHGLCLLLTSRVPAKEFVFSLPDIRSRLSALPYVHIESPDDKILEVFLIKQFADRQLQVSKEVIGFLLKRMERSFTDAVAIVEIIERSSLEHKKEITIHWVKSLIQR